MAPFYRSGIVGCAFAALLLFVLAAPARSQSSQAPARVSVSAAPTPICTPIFSASWLGRLYSKLESALGDPKWFIRFSLLCVLLGLWIIWWRKK